MQLALGAVYAWSVFRIPLSKTFGWSIQDVTWAFSLAILALGFAAFVGGLWMRKVGPRVVGITAAICYGLGVGLSGLGPKWVGSIYGLMLTAWGFAGVFGPLLIANIRQTTGKYDAALVVIALIMLVSAVLPLIIRARRVERQPVGAGARI
jgi:nitrate/nitrite transporter NarK